MNLNTSKLILVGLTSAMAIIIGASSISLAQQQSISDDHAKLVTSNCTSAQSSLDRIHRNDTSLRLDRGRQFEFISSKLMARLNGRLALNQFDASELVSVTSKYKDTVDEFRDAYYHYETKLSQVLKINCHDNPQAFYNGTQDTREKRQKVLDKVTEVNRLAEDYYLEFNQLRGEYRAAVRGVQND